MVTILFHTTIFGPIHSRRLGSSLGINLSPVDGKVCSFDCIYCEAGYNSQGPGRSGLPSRAQVKEQLEKKLQTIKLTGGKLDTLTFSGNGEPTMHPEFAGIIDDVVALRDAYFPKVKISVLSNASRISDQAMAAALLKVDNNILKLDSALPATLRLINRPVSPAFSLEETISRLAGFGKKCIIQTMLLRGEHEGVAIDNTADQEIEALIRAYKRINPKEVMLYSLDRATPEEKLEKIPAEELQAIAGKIRKENITVQTS